MLPADGLATDPAGRDDPGIRGLLAGHPVGRRTVLRAAAGAAIGAPWALVGCGTTSTLPKDNSYLIVADGSSPPLGDLARLVAARARAVGMNPALVQEKGSAPTYLPLQTGLGSFDPKTNSTPPINQLIVLGAAYPATVEPIVATAIRRGVKIVSYPTVARYQTAAIVVDAGAAAVMLASHAAAWAQKQLGGKGGVLVVLPPATPPVGNFVDSPYLSDGPTVEQAIRTTLARAAPGLKVVATARAQGSPGASAGLAAVRAALASSPGVRVVLVWDDDTAIGAAHALVGHYPASEHKNLYVGGLGAPAVTSRATFTLLQRNDVLRAVVAAGVRDLANAMVDLPRSLVGGAAAHNITLPPQLLTPGSSALASYSSDYSLHPDESGSDFSPIYQHPLNPKS
jgi:ABC-type sugar transport system substrate-binding protein